MTLSHIASSLNDSDVIGASLPNILLNSPLRVTELVYRVGETDEVSEYLFMLSNSEIYPLSSNLIRGDLLSLRSFFMFFNFIILRISLRSYYEITSS